MPVILNLRSVLSPLNESPERDRMLRKLSMTGITRNSGPYSHSIVAGGLLEISYTTRLIPRTWLMILLLTSARKS